MKKDMEIELPKELLKKLKEQSIYWWINVV